MNLLKKYLDKIGVKEFSELSESEKETYRSWDDALNGRKITDEEVGTFLNQEESETISKLLTAKLSEREDVFLKVKLEMIIKIKNFLNLPNVEKRMVERNLEELIK